MNIEKIEKIEKIDKKNRNDETQLKNTIKRYILYYLSIMQYFNKSLLFILFLILSINAVYLSFI